MEECLNAHWLAWYMRGFLPVGMDMPPDLHIVCAQQPLLPFDIGVGDRASLGIVIDRHKAVVGKKEPQPSHLPNHLMLDPPNPWVGLYSLQHLLDQKLRHAP